MKRLSAKRITAMIAGAALLGMGLAFSGPVSFSNVPIISNSGQPVVQVVIGSGAKASDGVAAANIAAAIGNLAFTTVPVSAGINATQAQSVLHVSISSPTYSLTNQQVWLNESASALTSGTYGFTALIGSVLNGAVQLGAPASTKALQGSSGTQYAYPESSSLTASPAPSPYTGVGFVPLSTSVGAATNGGGVSFTTFTLNNYDNILRVSNAQLPGLLSNSGTYGENEYLWLTGFPVFDQASGVNNFALLDANGAYQITFNKPISTKTSSGSINQASFSLLGQNYTIIKYTAPTSSVGSGNYVTGGSLQLAASLTPLTTVYVGSNLTTGPFKVVLNDLGQPNANGISPAAITVYYNGAITNTSSIMPPNTTKFNVSGHNLYVDVNETFAGLYAYEKWAKIKLYSNVFTLSNGASYNTTTNPNWYTVLQWTNASSTGTTVDALQGITIYGSSSESQTLLPGQSFEFITSPAVWKLQFIGETLSSANFDPVTAKLSAVSSMEYQNTGTSQPTISISNITEPAQLLTVESSIPNAFSYAGQTSSKVVYDLTPYELTETSNAVNPIVLNNLANTISLSYTGLSSAITPTNPLVVQISGYTSNTATSAQTTPLTFNATTQTLTSSTNFYNITSIQLNRALPGTLSVYANAINSNEPFSGKIANSVNDAIDLTSSNSLSINGNTIYINANSVSSTNEITFSLSSIPINIPTNVPFSGNIAVTSPDTPSSAGTLTLAGNIPFDSTISLSNGGSLSIVGNVPISNTIGYTTAPISNSIFVSGNLVVEELITPASGSFSITGNIPISGSNVITETTPVNGIISPIANVVASGSSSLSTNFARLNSVGAPQILYGPSTGKNYYSTSSASTVTYNQQNGQPTTSFTLAPSSTAIGAQTEFFTYTMQENPVPTDTAAHDTLGFGILNSTGGVTATPLFNLNYSTTGAHNNMTYNSTTGASFSVQTGFRTEKGSKIASITPTSLTVNFAKAVDKLQYAVAPVSTTISKTYKLFGPYGIGQATNIPNVSIGAVNASIALSGTTHYTITGINNITATPSISSADSPVLLKSLPTSPLVVLDSHANPNSNLILIGSGYVNSLSAQLQKAYNITMTPSTQILQAYGNKILVAGYYANETTKAANQFINDLYAAASTS